MAIENCCTIAINSKKRIFKNSKRQKKHEIINQQHSELISSNKRGKTVKKGWKRKNAKHETLRLQDLTLISELFETEKH